uniref:Uncharacterized protein n=1 Tax=Lotus japonicus TaxID=34305 RepID=I3SHQ1_LOTJA|nr:unknown [Lotus japonicus]
MWFAFASGRIRVLLCLSLLLLLLCCNHVDSIRIFPGNAVANVKFTRANGMQHNNTKEKEDLFNKYFTGPRSSDLTNTTQKGFGETKRVIPSCPDPLHN